MPPGLSHPARSGLVELKEDHSRAETFRVPDDRRIEWGHALTRAGLLARRGCTPLALVTLAALLFAAGVPSLPGLDAASTLAIPAVAFLGGRTLAVGLGAIGWIVFPAGHRAFLAELAARARDHG